MKQDISSQLPRSRMVHRSKAIGNNNNKLSKSSAILMIVYLLYKLVPINVFIIWYQLYIIRWRKKKWRIRRRWEKNHTNTAERTIYLRLMYVYNSFWCWLIRMKTVYYILYTYCIIITTRYRIQYYMCSTYITAYMIHCIILWPAYKKQLPVITRPNTLYIIIIVNRRVYRCVLCVR